MHMIERLQQLFTILVLIGISPVRNAPHVGTWRAIALAVWYNNGIDAFADAHGRFPIDAELAWLQRRRDVYIDEQGRVPGRDEIQRQVRECVTGQVRACS